MHLEQIPDMGATFLDRLNVPVDSSAFGLLKFILLLLSIFFNALYGLFLIYHGIRQPSALSEAVSYKFFQKKDVDNINSFIFSYVKLTEMNIHSGRSHCFFGSQAKFSCRMLPKKPLNDAFLLKVHDEG